jgi:hypothetical protein
MSMRAVMMLVILFGTALSQHCAAQVIDVNDLLRDIQIVEREEAEAKKIRLEWITKERSRIHSELKEHEGELETLKEMVPDPRRERALLPIEAQRRELEKRQFNEWASETTPERRYAVINGRGPNALLKMLGPIAHYRKQREVKSSREFPSLDSSQYIDSGTAGHLNLSPATMAGSQLVIRLNQNPLEIQWPTVLNQFFPSDCQRIEKLRDEYSRVLNSPRGSDVAARLESWKLFDESLELLQAKVVKKRQDTTQDRTLEGSRRVKMYVELRDGIRYMESIRVAAERYKNVPADYKIRSFPGGSIEDFLAFCYTHGMILKPANPGDEEAYMKLGRQMQDYARDVQYVEDWKKELEERMDELSAQDKALVWRASAR